MNELKPTKWLILPLMILLASCDPFGSNNRYVEPVESPAEIDGWAPVYAKDGNAAVISSENPRQIVKSGKIYVKGNMLYQVEVGSGIHVIDITDRNNPRKVKFINVVGAQEMAIMNDLLYTNNVNDLVVVDILDINNVKLIDRVEGMFHMVDPTLPPSSGYFECIDPKQGVVVGWEQKVLYNPVCRKN